MSLVVRATDCTDWHGLAQEPALERRSGVSPLRERRLAFSCRSGETPLLRSTADISSISEAVRRPLPLSPLRVSVAPCESSEPDTEASSDSIIRLFDNSIISPRLPSSKTSALKTTLLPLFCAHTVRMQMAKMASTCCSRGSLTNRRATCATMRKQNPIYDILSTLAATRADRP